MLSVRDASVVPVESFSVTVMLAVAVPVLTIANAVSEPVAGLRNRGTIKLPRSASLEEMPTLVISLPPKSRTSKNVDIVTLPLVTNFAQLIVPSRTAGSLAPAPAMTRTLLAARLTLLNVPVNDGTLAKFVVYLRFEAVPL